MLQPWRIEDGEVVQVDPWPDGGWRVARGDWAAAEALLGTELPADYKELIGDSDGVSFAEELHVASPFRDHPRANLLPGVAAGSWSIAYLRVDDPGLASVRVFPEPGGVLWWGSDGGGGDYYWDTSAGGPDSWTVWVSGRSVVPELSYPMGLVSYLELLGEGLIEAAALDEWPPPGSRPVRREP